MRPSNKLIIRKITIVSFSFYLFVSCSRNKQLVNEIKQMQSVPIDLCIDSMLYYQYKSNENNNIVDSISFYKENLSLVAYYDSNDCSSCTAKDMYRWFELLNTIVSEYENKLKIYFIFTSKQGDMHALCHSIKTSNFDYPIFIDTTNVFRRRNKHLPENPQMHTFMLDRKRNVILVGSPLENESIRNLFFKIANDSI